MPHQAPLGAAGWCLCIALPGWFQATHTAVVLGVTLAWSRGAEVEFHLRLLLVTWPGVSPSKLQLPRLQNENDKPSLTARLWDSDKRVCLKMFYELPKEMLPVALNTCGSLTISLEAGVLRVLPYPITSSYALHWRLCAPVCCSPRG